MKGHTKFKPSDRNTEIENIVNEIKTIDVEKSALEDGKDARMSGFRPKKFPGREEKPSIHDRYRHALYRDSQYAVARGVWLRSHGISNAVVDVYNGSKQLVDGGNK